MLCDKQFHMYTVAFERGNLETPGTTSWGFLVEGDPPGAADLESSQPAAATLTWSREARGEGNADIDARRSDISA